MKILEIIPQLSQGGAERFVVDLCNEMSREHEVTLIVLHNLDKNGFFVQELNPSIKIISMNKKMGMDFSLFFRLFSEIRKAKPDVVHTHLRGIVYSLFAILFCCKIKFFHTLHSDAFKEAGENLSLWIRKFVFKLKLVTPITISEESQKSFYDLYKTNSLLVYNGRPSYIYDELNVDLAKKEFLKDKVLTLVNVARVSPEKNQLALASIVDNLNKKGHNIDLYIIGRKDGGIVTQQIEEKNFDSVFLIGPRTNPRDYIAAADAFCLSSLYEGMPITLIECFSVGAIPICTPVGGIKNMIQDGVNGILAQSTSEEDIEAAVVRFINLADDEKQRMREASLASFEQYNMTTCAQKYIKAFYE